MAEGEPTPVATQEPTAPAPAEATQTQTAAPASVTDDKPVIQPNGEAEPKPEGDAPLIEPEPKKEEPAKPEGAPESYEAFTVPEGFQMDNDRMTEASSIFKELNLTQGNAQKLIDAYCKFAKDQQTAAENQLLERQKEWRSSIRSREDFREQKALADKGVRLLLTTDAQRKLFTGTWLQDSPELFDLFVTAGRLVAEDNMSKTTQSAQPSEAQINMARFPDL
jgi:hypothetical protein